MKWYFWVLIVLVIAVIVYFVVKNKTKATGSAFGGYYPGSAFGNAYQSNETDCFKKCMAESNASSGEAAVIECTDKCK